MINVEEDGITHINIYSKGKTELGRFLSNFSLCPIITEDGNFKSIEGYWYWLLCDHDNKDVLKTLVGFAAKDCGRNLKARDWDNSEEFKNKIKKAILIKINFAHKDFLKNNLPFEHYYVYGGKIVKPKEGQWIIDYFNELRIANSQSK